MIIRKFYFAVVRIKWIEFLEKIFNFISLIIIILIKFYKKIDEWEL